MITIERPPLGEVTVVDAPSIDGSTIPASTPTKRRRVRVGWPVVVAVVAFAQYTFVSVWLLYVRHYAIGDALSRTATAKIMVLGRDPHLGSMGYYWMPFPTLARIPFVLLLQPFGRAELAGPLTSSLFAAATIPVLVAIGRVLRLSGGTIAVIVGIFALNPVTIYIASNGMSETTFGFFIAVTLYGYLRWRHDAATVSLAIIGLALGGAMASRFETLVITPAMCACVALCAEKGRRVQTAVLVGLPAAVVFFLWSLASYLIMGDWLFWKGVANEMTSTPADAVWLPQDRSLGRLLMHDGFLVVALAPAVLLVVLGVLRFPKRWRTSVGVVGLMLLLPTVVTWQSYEGTSWDVPRFYALVPMLVTIGVMWLIRSARGSLGWSRGFTFGGVALLALGCITGTHLLADVELTSVEGESVFFGALLGRPSDETSLQSADGPAGFLDVLPAFERIDRDLAPSFEAGKTVALDSIIAIPVLVSAHPDSYIIPEDRDFEPIIADPIGRVDFILRMDTRATGYGVLLDNVIATADGGNWVEVGSYEGYIHLYEWVPTGQQPTFVQEPQLQTPAPDL